jgi:hypothetical protein
MAEFAAPEALSVNLFGYDFADTTVAFALGLASLFAALSIAGHLRDKTAHGVKSTIKHATGG